MKLNWMINVRQCEASGWLGKGVDQEVSKLRSEVEKECLSKKVKYEGMNEV